MVKKINKCMKNIDMCDMYCVKTATIAFVLFLITVWPAFLNLVIKVHWGWFLAAMIVFMWRPLMKCMKA